MRLLREHATFPLESKDKSVGAVGLFLSAPLRLFSDWPTNAIGWLQCVRLTLLEEDYLDILFETAEKPIDAQFLFPRRICKIFLMYIQHCVHLWTRSVTQCWLGKRRIVGFGKKKWIINISLETNDQKSFFFRTTFLFLSSLRAESARAVTGRRCPHSGEGKTFWRVNWFFFYENSCNSEMESCKWLPR